MALDCRGTGNKAVLRRAQTCRNFEVRTREQTDNMTLLTKGPVPKQRIDTFTGSESQEDIRALSKPPLGSLVSHFQRSGQPVDPMSDHGT